MEVGEWHKELIMSDLNVTMNQKKEGVIGVCVEMNVEMTVEMSEMR